MNEQKVSKTEMTKMIKDELANNSDILDIQQETERLCIEVESLVNRLSSISKDIKEIKNSKEIK